MGERGFGEGERGVQQGLPIRKRREAGRRVRWGSGSGRKTSAGRKECRSSRGFFGASRTRNGGRGRGERGRRVAGGGGSDR